MLKKTDKVSELARRVAELEAELEDIRAAQAEMYTALYRFGPDSPRWCAFLKIVFAYLQDFDRAEYWHVLSKSQEDRRCAQFRPGDA